MVNISFQFILLSVIAVAMAAPGAVSEADPKADAQIFYGYPYAYYTYPRSYVGYRYLGKRSADAEPEANANPEADPSYLYAGYRYGPAYFYSGGYYGYPHAGYGYVYG